MAQAEQYDVFLSYRRKSGVTEAMLIKGDLEKRGFHVFIDKDGLGAGEFDRQLYQRIDECRGLVLILSPNALERCENEQDWVRKELEYAREKGKNIIPVLLDNFSFPAGLPQSINFVRRLHGLRFSTDYYDAFIDRLTRFLKSEPVLSPITAKPDFVAGRDNVLMEEINLGTSEGACASAKVFSTTLKRRQIRTITFSDTLANVPKDALDFSWNKSRSVLGWTRKSSYGLYDLYIAGEGGVSAPTDCQKLFAGYINATGIDFNGAFHTDHATSFMSMFSCCEKLAVLDLSSFYTSNVTDMGGMFSWCERLTTLDVSTFDTSKVTDMSLMFSCCYRLNTLEVSNFDTSRATDMSDMFSNCTNLTSLDVSGFDTSKVTDIRRMFFDCNNLRSLDISNFNFSNVIYYRDFMPYSLDPNWERYFTRK